MRRAITCLVVGALTICSCARDDGSSTSSPASSPPAAAPSLAATPVGTGTTAPPTERATTTTTTTAPSTTTTSEPKLEVPPGILAVVPTQNREDPAKRQFQLQFLNGTPDRFDVSGVRFVWSGFTTEFSPRDSIIVGGQTIDFPVPFPGAVCVGDGTGAEMPPVESATVELSLDDGRVLQVPVYDVWHLVRKLYLEDCERTFIESQVTIEWADLHESEFEGRPVTEGVLRVTRQAADADVVVLDLSDTIPYLARPIDTAVGEALLTVPAGARSADARVRFLESRCDPHALAEVKQPHKFIIHIDLGDGVARPYIVTPDDSWWVSMRRIADEACVALGKVEFVGENG